MVDGTSTGGAIVSGRLVLVRHGQSFGNVERRLDTRPPGAALTELGHEQAQTFTRDWSHPSAWSAIRWPPGPGRRPDTSGPA